MDLRRIIAAPKAAVKIGEWKNGKIPHVDFPIAKSAYKIGNSYRWCIISFDAVEQSFKCAVIFNAGKRKYEAILGGMAGVNLKILCSWQFHEGEPGWHCHAACDPVLKVSPGIMRGPWIKRIPAARSRHRRIDFNVDSEIKAVHLALRRYRIETKGPLI